MRCVGISDFRLFVSFQQGSALPAGFGLRNVKREFLNQCKVLSWTWLFLYGKYEYCLLLKVLSIVLGLFLTVKHAWQGLKTNASVSISSRIFMKRENNPRNKEVNHTKAGEFDPGSELIAVMHLGLILMLADLGAFPACWQLRPQHSNHSSSWHSVFLFLPEILFGFLCWWRNTRD